MSDNGEHSLVFHVDGVPPGHREPGMYREYLRYRRAYLGSEPGSDREQEFRVLMEARVTAETPSLASDVQRDTGAAAARDAAKKAAARAQRRYSTARVMALCSVAMTCWLAMVVLLLACS